jgi:prolyl 4-hydroxylase
MVSRFVVIGIALIVTVLFITIGIILINYLNKSGNKSEDLNNFDDNNFFFEIENVLTPQECDKLINDSNSKLSRSKVMSLDKNNKYEDRVDDVRTSHHTWLNNSQYKEIIQKVEKLVNSFLKNKISSKQFEDIQVARYQPSQEYKQHYDICHPTQGFPEHIKTCKEDYKKYNSVRYITVILYLNDGFEGGETFFPRLNTKIKPKKGKALVFFNCNLNKNTHKNGLCDVITNSEHSGLPVIQSHENLNEKWIANIWIRTKNI